MSWLIRYKLINSSIGSIRSKINSSVATFDYPCESQSECTPIIVNLSPGRFRIEVWGAQGGSNGNGKGGRGGYSSGVISIIHPTSFYLYIGGTQTFNRSNVIQPGGYNGGGNGSSKHVYHYGCGGGGATDLRLNYDDLSSRIIVAGGGGGCGKEEYAPGVGGGLEGGNGTINVSGYSCAVEGGKQNVRGLTYYYESLSDIKHDSKQYELIYSGFGYGASWIRTDGSGWSSGGGGGGWFGGGGGCVYSGSGAGGSGYVFSSSSVRLPSMYIPSKYQFSEQIMESGLSQNGNEGNGWARFTVIEEFVEHQCIKTHRTRCNPVFSFVFIVSLFVS